MLSLCSEARLAVVPFGGGTSVVGGVEPVRDGFAGAISLDLRRLDGLDDVDRVSLTASFGAGLLGPEAERRLAREGLTLGHLPQSFEFSTVGGWVATRSAGQASTGYGRIDELVEGVRLVAPSGELNGRALPASAAGPDLRELVVGSEGVLGVICRGHAAGAPVARRAPLRGLGVPLVRGGLRRPARDGAGGRVAGRGAAVRRGGDAAVDGPGLERGHDRADRQDLPAPARPRGRMRGHHGLRRRCRRRGAPPPARIGAAARRRRAAAGPPARRALAALPATAGPYLRDELLDRGVLVDTLETATGWSNLSRLYLAVIQRPSRHARRARHAPAGHVPRLPPLPLGSIALLHVSGPPGSRGPSRPVACGQNGRERGDHGRGRHDQPPPRRRPRSRPLDARRGRRPRSRAAPRRQGAPRPGRNHEPRASCCRRRPARRGPLGAARAASCRAPASQTAETKGGRGRMAALSRCRNRFRATVLDWCRPATPGQDAPIKALAASPRPWLLSLETQARRLSPRRPTPPGRARSRAHPRSGSSWRRPAWRPPGPRAFGTRSRLRAAPA